MISKERLEKLFKKEAIIYDNKGIAYKTGYQCYIQDNKFCFKYSLDSIPLEDLYETQEEVEFVAEYHCSKTIKFEPPTFEEFLKTKTKERFAHWFSPFDIDIVMYEKAATAVNQIIVSFDRDNDYDKTFTYENNEYDNTCKQAYYQAVEYAKKLFLGEE